ncbi:MAG: M43 family zinc metalloprotease [Bacteroidota bacterium]|jgi:hypothetical protein
MLKRCIIFLSLAFAFQTQAQDTKCVTDYYFNLSKKIYPDLEKLEKQATEIGLQASQQPLQKTGTIRYIPVVFHVIHKNGLENISQAQIMNQIRILNEDFRRKPGTNGGKSTNSVAADMEFEFRLAQYDPNGNKHDGINRIFSNQTDNANNAVKALSYWNSEKYLNVWVVNTIASISGTSGIVLGYAQFPFQRNSQPTTDGIVVRADQIGMLGTADKSQAGRTLTHEIGHWMGLFHTFQGGCSGSGDGVSDTPPCASASSGCDKTRNSCNNDNPNLRDMIENYMDYSDGNCLELFTQGQKSFAYTQMQQYRSLIYANDVTYAGIDANGNYLTPPATTFIAPIAFDFENGDPLLSKGFTYNNFNNPSFGWRYTKLAGYSSTASLYIPNFSNPGAVFNTRDGFQTPEIDLLNLNSPFIEFYYAWVQKTFTNFDSLIVLVSSDFGMTEERVFAERGPELATANPINTDFIPSQTQWKKVSISVWKMHRKRNVRFRFEFVNRQGNNVFVDQISISDGSTGLHNALKNEINFSLQPNPMNENAFITFDLNEKKNIHITLTDVVGREVKTIEKSMLSAGFNQVELHKGGLKSGIYYLRFEAGQQRFTHKILIN